MGCQRDYFSHHYNIPNANYAYLYSPISSPLHRHEDFYEFSLIIQGSFINEYNGQTQLLRKNSLIYFRCGEAHSITAEIGFSSESHFIQKFKKYHGITPKEYQRISHMDASVISLTGVNLPQTRKK